jgi:hypothetical protein
MYYSWKPWPGQRTLSLDDKLGLSEVYPTPGDECGGCLAEETCWGFPLGGLCQQPTDPIGAPCNYDRVECEAFCLFTARNLSTGYCSKFCELDTDCPQTHHCAEAMAGAMPVKVCFAGAQLPPCTADDACPSGQHCDIDRGACTFECRTTADCASGTCDARGSCTESDGGCNAPGGPGGEPVIGLGILAAWWASRRRRRGPSAGSRA